ncbi:MAG: hypothetical protein QM778_33190 [Myxococcales bacterium]
MATGPNIPTIPLDLGMRNTSESRVQPFGPSPALQLSRNTRLGRVQGVPTKAPMVTAWIGATDEQRQGLVPSGRGNTLLVARKRNELLRGNTAKSTLVPSTISPANPQNSYAHYWPQIDAPAPGGYGAAAGAPALEVDANGYTWILQMRSLGIVPSGSKAMITVLAPDGSVAVPPTPVADSTITATGLGTPWGSITCHAGSNAVVWWNSSGNAVSAVQLTLNTATMTVTVGTPAVVFTNNSYPAFAVHSDRHAQYAWLITQASGAANSFTVSRVTIGTWAQLSTTQALGALPHAVAIKHITYGTDELVAICVGSNTSGGGSGVAKSQLLEGLALTPVFALQTVDTQHDGPVAVSMMFHPIVGNHVVAASSARNNSSGVAPPTRQVGTVFTFLDLITGAAATPFWLPFKQLMSCGGWDRTGTMVVPLFGLQGSASAIAGAGDPYAEVFRACSRDSVALVGRFGVDQAFLVGASFSWASLTQGPDGRIWFTYQELNKFKTGTTNGGVVGRYVVMSPTEPITSVKDDTGVSLLSGGPVYWDGVEVAEVIPTQRPQVFAEANTGTGVGWTAGTYLISAVIMWGDCAGNVRRSYPAAAISLTVAGGQKPKVFVSLPASMRNGVRQETARITVFATLQGGTSPFYQQSSWVPDSVQSTMAVFGNIGEPVIDTAIYTTGSASLPLGAQCPPSFQDVAIVGNRAWGIDARGILWYSKPKEDGYGFEFSSLQVKAIPASAGKRATLEELGGVLAVLTERGTWEVTGGGPDASFAGGSFNDPQQISDIPCSSRTAVVRTPMGILFQSGTRFATLGGELGTGILDDFETYDGASYTAISLPDTKEVVWLYDSYRTDGVKETLHAVFNYGERKFTCWGPEVTTGAKGACLDPVSGLFQFLRENLGIATMDPDSVTGAPMTFLTGDIILGGTMEEADCALQKVLVSCKRLSDHTLDFGIGQDFANALDRIESYAFAQIANASKMANGRYTLAMGPKGTVSMRAVSVYLSLNGSGDCVRPYAITLVYSQKSGTKADAVYQSAAR